MYSTLSCPPCVCYEDTGLAMQAGWSPYREAFVFLRSTDTLLEPEAEATYLGDVLIARCFIWRRTAGEKINLYFRHVYQLSVGMNSSTIIGNGAIDGGRKYTWKRVESPYICCILYACLLTGEGEG